MNPGWQRCGAFGESERLEERPVVAQLQPDIDPQPVRPHPAGQPLSLGHQGPPNSGAPLQRLDRQPAGIGKIRLPLDRDAAKDPAIPRGKQDRRRPSWPPGSNLGAFRQRARFRPQRSAILPECAMDERDDRIGLLGARRSNRGGGCPRSLVSARCGSFRIQEAILSSSELADQRRNRLLGLGATLLAAFFVSLITTFARITYDSGSNPATQVFLRSLCMMLVLGALQLMLGRGLILPRRLIPRPSASASASS